MLVWRSLPQSGESPYRPGKLADPDYALLMREAFAEAG